MNANVISAVIGFLASVAMGYGIASVIYGVRFREIQVKHIGEEIRRDTEDTTRDVLVEIRDLIAASIANDPPGYITDMITSRDLHHESILKFISEMADRLEKPLIEISADSLASRKKFDVLGELLGLDSKQRLAEQIEAEPEQSSEAFDQLVSQAMREQGLNYSQATSAVRSRMASRSRR